MRGFGRVEKDARIRSDLLAGKVIAWPKEQAQNDRRLAHRLTRICQFNSPRVNTVFQCGIRSRSPVNRDSQVELPSRSRSSDGIEDPNKIARLPSRRFPMSCTSAAFSVVAVCVSLLRYPIDLSVVSFTLSTTYFAFPVFTLHYCTLRGWSSPLTLNRRSILFNLVRKSLDIVSIWRSCWSSAHEATNRDRTRLSSLYAHRT